ncbi:hypothetical protein [Ktedonospora formicarum]|uniref:DUF2914 domain-containing protein n=1 Tax=Ktedonospora formicarum TaxID=2778364 RepID=A0A8J3HWI1_9CHLR|nr:hypothetical protein [Ktedonospora formicarum]GHO45059.1 hypothetical protein KSX_32220 [Ktedonospora formicarum]
MFATYRALLCIAALLLLAIDAIACASAASPQSKSVMTATPGLTATATQQANAPRFSPPTSCQESSLPANSTLYEAQGTAQNAELWALLMPTKPLPLHAKQEVKIVWRMTGTGEVHLKAYTPNGKSVEPVWGPEGHSGSNWNRPGDEWGTGFMFPTSGCWDIHVERTNAAGDVWLNVK